MRIEMRRRTKGQKIELEPWTVTPGCDGTYLGFADKSYWHSKTPTICIHLCEVGAEEPDKPTVLLSDAEVYPGGANGLLTFEDGTEFHMTYAWKGIIDYTVHAELITGTRLTDLRGWINQQRTKFGFVPKSSWEWE